MDQVDPEQHAGLLQQLGVDPQQLLGGAYQQHLDAQQQPGFSGLPAGLGLLGPAAGLRPAEPGYGSQGERFDQGDGFDQPGGDFNRPGGGDFNRQARGDDFGGQGDPSFSQQEDDHPGRYGEQRGF